jgi:hypothetical protein
MMGWHRQRLLLRDDECGQQRDLHVVLASSIARRRDSTIDPLAKVIRRPGWIVNIAKLWTSFSRGSGRLRKQAFGIRCSFRIPHFRTDRSGPPRGSCRPAAHWVRWARLGSARGYARNAPSGRPPCATRAARRRSASR